LKRHVKILAMILILVFTMTAIVGCGSDGNTTGGDTQNKTFKIKVANWYAPEHPQNLALAKFKEIVEEKSEGNIIVEIYDNSKLGSEDVFIDSVKNGTVEMGVPGTMLSKDMPLLSVAEIPFLFRDYDHAYAVLNGPIGDKMLEGMEAKIGVRNLAWTVNGLRQMTSNKELKSMEDFKGLRMRVPNVPYYVQMTEALGMVPTTMAFSEVFTALEQKVIDGQENPYATIRASSFNEVQKYVLETNHMFSPNEWIINEKFFQSLGPEYQKIVEEAAKEAAAYNWELAKKKEAEDKEWLKQNGMTIIEPDEAFKQQMIDSQKEVRQWFYDNYPGSEDLVKEIEAM